VLLTGEVCHQSSGDDAGNGRAPCINVAVGWWPLIAHWLLRSLVVVQAVLELGGTDPRSGPVQHGCTGQCYAAAVRCMLWLCRVGDAGRNHLVSKLSGFGGRGFGALTG
jgi:hypothetical protein